MGPGLRESRLLAPSGRGGEFTQPRAHLLAEHCTSVTMCPSLPPSYPMLKAQQNDRPDLGSESEAVTEKRAYYYVCTLTIVAVTNLST